MQGILLLCLSAKLACIPFMHVLLTGRQSVWSLKHEGGIFFSSGAQQGFRDVSVLCGLCKIEKIFGHQAFFHSRAETNTDLTKCGKCPQHFELCFQ